MAEFHAGRFFPSSKSDNGFWDKFSFFEETQEQGKIEEEDLTTTFTLYVAAIKDM